MSSARFGLEQAADADAVDRPGRRRRARSAAPIARSAAAVASDVAAVRQPSIRLRPRASAARIRARCEIDLSPGTRGGAAKRPAGSERRRLGPLALMGLGF